MASRDLMLGQSRCIGFGQVESILVHSHNIGLRQNHDVEGGQGNNKNLEHYHHDIDLGTENSEDQDVEVHQHHHRLKDYMKKNIIAVDQKNEHDDVDPDLVRSSLNQELSSFDNNYRLVDEDLEFGDSFGLLVDSNHGVEIGHHDEKVIVTTPVQARAHVADMTSQLTVGQEFPDVKSCRRAIRDIAIALHFEMQTIKSDKTRFTAKCSSKGCLWRVHAAKLPGVPTFTIRTINKSHNYGGIKHLGHHQASVQWVARSSEERLRQNPNIKPKEILEEIYRVHGITISYKQAWRGKERIVAAMRGYFEEEYRLLPRYCEQVKRTNPGSIASVYGSPADNCFHRLFISFEASIYGFLNACRPLLGLDRTSMKSKYLGTLLLATGFDGDGALFPLAFGIVDEENDENWMWFLRELHTLLENNTENMLRLTILSDRQRGKVEGVEQNFPTAFHGFCMLHLSETFRNIFNNTILVNYLWEAAQALTVIEFKAKILEIAKISEDAANLIRRIPPRLWATAYFEGQRFGHFTANIVESLNSWTVEASGLPIIQMMECIWKQLRTWFVERREASMQWTSLLIPTAERHVAEALKRAMTYQVLRANESEFEVISHEGKYNVDIRNRRCFCRGWQSCGLPCAHAVAALLSCRQNVHRFTEKCFTVATYKKTYSQTIQPIPDKSLWRELSEEDPNMNKAADEVIINPPKSMRPPGTLRKRRVRAGGRGQMKRVVHCSRCNQSGHFRTTCAAPI